MAFSEAVGVCTILFAYPVWQEFLYNRNTLFGDILFGIRRGPFSPW